MPKTARHLHFKDNKFDTFVHSLLNTTFGRRMKMFSLQKLDIRINKQCKYNNSFFLSLLTYSKSELASAWFTDNIMGCYLHTVKSVNGKLNIAYRQAELAEKILSDAEISSSVC